MNSTYQDLYNSYLRADKNKVAELARKSFFNIVNKISSDTGDQEFAFNATIHVFASFVVMDKELSASEWALFQYIMQKNISREKVFEICKVGENARFTQEMKKIADQDKNFREDIITLGLCICAIDGEVTPDEHSLIKYYID